MRRSPLVVVGAGQRDIWHNSYILIKFIFGPADWPYGEGYATRQALQKGSYSHHLPPSVAPPAVNDLNLKGTYSGTVTPALGGKGVNAPFEKM